MILIQLWRYFDWEKPKTTTVTLAELKFCFYCFRDDLEHAETYVMYSVNSATANFLKTATV